MHPFEFQQKWTGSTLTERSGSQSHFNDLCAVLGVPTPTDADTTGERYTFEKGAAKSTGGKGWADVWYRGHFAWEYKGPHKDLAAAYDQLLRYKDDLENPPLMVVSDLDRIIIRTNFTGTVLEKHEITLATFAEPESQATLRRLFTDPGSFRPGTSVDAVTEEAAKRFGRIAQGLTARGEDPAAVAHFLVQVLFCLFAEDIGLLPEKVFSRLLAFGRRNPGHLRAQTQALLETMATGGIFYPENIPQVNGGLFRTVRALELTPDEVGVLAEAAELDWSAVEPAVFGTLFERSLDPAQRSQLGAHYTGRADILRVVEPVVLAPLRRRWDDLRPRLDEMADSRDAAKTTRTREARQATLVRTLRGFTDELAAVTVLDPACGSGNFLYVALDALLTLEKEALTYGATRAGLPLGLPSVRPSQVLGLEVNAYAQELAQAVIWIGYLQWMKGNGFGWTEPVLEDLQTIRLQDALVDVGDDGQPRRTAWPEATYIIGNPPFLGGKMLRRELTDEYVDRLFTVYTGEVGRESDLCCYFFEQGRVAIEQGRSQRAGLLATNSIRGGANREVLKRIKASGDIFMAWSDEPWVLNGAAVRISIVGFDDGEQGERSLDGMPVATINSDLTATVDITGAAVLQENSGIGFMGDTKGGKFDLSPDLAAEVLRAIGNPHGQPNREVVRPWINGLDVVRRPRGFWIVDFGTDMPVETAALYEAPFAHVLENVKPARDTNKRDSYRERWWVHVEPRPAMRGTIAGLRRFLVTPTVAKHRLFKWFDSEYLPDHQLIVFAREDDYFFGVLHSRAHEVWSLRMGTWLGKGNDPRYTPTTTFETFPLPWPPGTEPTDDPRVTAIGDAAKRLDELRERWLNPQGASEADLKTRTLTNLYNTRPTWLTNAHAALDRAVWDAYGWPPDETPAEVPEDVILARLLALNGERATSGQG